MSETSSRFTNSRNDSQGMAPLSETERYRLLASERRRTVLDVLFGRSCPIDVEDLAREVADRERNVAAAEDAVASVTTSLHHCHLPKLADHGVVDYDVDTGRVKM